MIARHDEMSPASLDDLIAVGSGEDESDEIREATGALA